MKYDQSLATPSTLTLQMLSFVADDEFIHAIEKLPLQGTEKWAEVRADNGTNVRIYSPEHVKAGAQIYLTVQKHTSPQGREQLRVNIAPTTDPRGLGQFVPISVGDALDRLKNLEIGI